MTKVIKVCDRCGIEWSYAKDDIQKVEVMTNVSPSARDKHTYDLCWGCAVKLQTWLENG